MVKYINGKFLYQILAHNLFTKEMIYQIFKFQYTYLHYPVRGAKNTNDGKYVRLFDFFL